MLEEIKNSKLKAIIAVISTFVFSIGLATSITSGVGDTYAANTCSAGTYFTGNGCQSCPANYYCPGGEFASGGVGGLYACPGGSTSSAGSSSLSACKIICSSGEYYYGNSECRTCPEDYYCPGGSFSLGGTAGLYSCPDGYTSYAGSTSCTIPTITCSAGRYYTGNGCQTCIAGYYCPGGEFASGNPGGIYKCDDGYTSSDGASSCIIDDSGDDSGSTFYNTYIKYKAAYDGKYSDVSYNSSSTNSSGVSFTWGVDSSGYILKNGSVAATTVYYGNTLATSGLMNYNNSEQFNATRTGYHVVAGEEWKCMSGCTTSGKVYSQSVAYKSTDFCSSYSDSCTAVLGINWVINKYTITYNANGGSGAPGDQTKTHGTTLTLSSTKPTRSGYTFLGWSTSSTATSATYTAGGSYTVEGDATLYAVWDKNSTVTFHVNYDANGGGGAPSVQTKTAGVPLTLSSTKPTREGYTFLGWSTDKTATSPKYAAGGSYTEDKTVTLFAVWKANTYIIRYDANGGTGVPGNQNKVHDTTLKLSTVEPTRVGYTFLGWNTDKTATTALYRAGGTYTKNEGALLYAVWSKNEAKTYTIKYDANGGSGAPLDQTKTEGKSLTLSSTIPTRDGYTFLGWNTNKSATTVMYKAGGTYTEDKAVTLFAIWSQDSKPTISYDIKYDANGGSGAPDSQIKVEGVDLKLSSTIPTKDGYTFLGWNTDKNATTAIYKAGDIYTKDEGATLYAVWDVYSKTDDEITNNNQTGNAFIYIVWAIGIGTLGYSVYYFRSKKNDI